MITVKRVIPFISEIKGKFEILELNTDESPLGFLKFSEFLAWVAREHRMFANETDMGFEDAAVIPEIQDKLLVFPGTVWTNNHGQTMLPYTTRNHGRSWINLFIHQYEGYFTPTMYVVCRKPGN